ncbi:hypothetical protein CL655_03470 [bacterium]|nr:hypothetical protein [bacterium]|tara:strand:- start:3064 stop:4959 length:1896 start_codon:yes stop_codon:yes gene_type:complete
MSYKVRANRQPLTTAGKITVLTTVGALGIFLLVFLLNLGQAEINNVSAQQLATTSVNVLNTPPQFLLEADEPNEETESSATNPTNSGDELAIVGTATDQNGAPYFLIVCATNAATAQSGAGDGSAPPTCDNNDQIAISTSTISGTEARAATTTTEAMPESNTWWAFACDDDAVNPECSPGYQGTTTTASPFVVNHRPTFTGIVNDGPVDPAGTLTFSATSSDTDSLGGVDTMQLLVCVSNDYNPTTNACGPAGTIATSTFTSGTPVVLSAATTTATPLQDDTYDAYVYVVDNHGHEASGGQQGANNQYVVANVAPTIDGALISLNGGLDMTLDTAAGETTGFTLTFVANDANSCENSVAGSEITNYIASVYRSGVGSTTCDGAGSNYNPNNCYESGAGADWNVSCTATTTGAGACGGPTDATELWECTFPLWYVADPTDPAAETPVYETEDWRAGISAVDDDSATSSFVQSTTANIEVVSFLSFALDTNAIPYGDLAPGDNTGNLNATTTTRATGNVGVDQELGGVHMCPDTFTVGGCPNVASTTATSSIAEYQQEYATSSLPYGSGQDLPATTSAQRLRLGVLKPTATSTQPSGTTYWGIEVPGTITLAGLYTGRNEFVAQTSSSTRWGP